MSPFAIRNKLGGGCTDRIKVPWKKYTEQLSRILQDGREKTHNDEEAFLFEEIKKLRKVIQEKEKEISISEALAIANKTKINEQHISLSQLQIEVTELTAENATLKSKVVYLEKRTQQLSLAEIENSRLTRDVGKLEGFIQAFRDRLGGATKIL